MGPIARGVAALVVSGTAMATISAVSCGYGGGASLDGPGGGGSEASPRSGEGGDALAEGDAGTRRGCQWPTLQAGAPWPMLGGCVTHAGRSGFRGPHTEPRELWKADTKAYHPIPAIGADDTVYVPADTDGILAFSPDGGVRKLAVGGGDVTNTPAIARDGTLYFGAGNFAVTLGPDAKAKRFDLTGAVDTSSVIDIDGNVYTASIAKKLVSFDAAGNLRWEVSTGGPINSSPAIGPNGDIYVGSWDHKLYAVVKDSTLHWPYDTGAEIRSSPVVADDGTIYIGTMDSKLHAVGADGTKKWIWDAPGPFDWQMLPALGWDGTIYTATETKVIALGPADARPLWTFDAKQTLRTPVVVDVDGIIYVGGDSNRIWAIGPDGKQLYELDVGDPPSGFAIGRDGTLYVTCAGSDRIHAFRE